MRSDPAVRRKLLDVEQGEAVLLEDRLGGSEGEVGKVLVVDRVELVPLDQAQQVGKLHA
jgi:hypothetical protein